MPEPESYRFAEAEPFVRCRQSRSAFRSPPACQRTTQPESSHRKRTPASGSQRSDGHATGAAPTCSIPIDRRRQTAPTLLRIDVLPKRRPAKGIRQSFQPPSANGTSPHHTDLRPATAPKGTCRSPESSSYPASMSYQAASATTPMAA